jgi:Tol biopolymer transport system component
VNLSGGAHFAVSSSGTLVYVPGGLDEADKTAVWVDRRGIEREIGVIPGLGFQYQLSPDGTRLVRPNAVGPTRDLYVDGLHGRRTSRRLSFGDFVGSAVWTPEGRIVYASGVSPSNLFWRSADGSGTEERLTTSDRKQMPSAVSPDGRLLAYVEQHPEGSSDIWVMPLGATGAARLLAGTPAAEGGARFSPDGRWIVYQSRTSGSAEVYLVPVTGPSRLIPVSNGEGWSPLWSPDGREIYFRNRRPASGEGHMLAVPVDTTGAEPVIGEPRVLFATPYQGEGDVGPDGRFLLLHRTRQASPARFIPVVIDWFADLEASVPAR